MGNEYYCESMNLWLKFKFNFDIYIIVFSSNIQTSTRCKENKHSPNHPSRITIFVEEIQLTNLQ